MIEKLAEMVLPEGILEWFELERINDLGPTMEIILREKDKRPPVPEEYRGKKITSRGFKSVTLLDYPIRGKRVLLKIFRRRWKIDGVKHLLIRDLKIKKDGSSFVADFADFLKDVDRRKAYRDHYGS